MEALRRKGPEMEEEHEGGRQARWKGLRKGRAGQMQFVVEHGNQRGQV